LAFPPSSTFSLFSTVFDRFQAAFALPRGSATFGDFRIRFDQFVLFRQSSFLNLFSLVSTAFNLSLSSFGLPQPSLTFAFAQFVSFRSSCFIDLQSLFSPLFDNEQEIGNGERDSHQNYLNCMQGPRYGHLAHETGLDEDHIHIFLRHLYI
jgi:hypothetical protein